MSFNGISLTPSGSALIAPFNRVYCQKILPAVFDDSLSYYELVCKIQEKMNEIIEYFNNQDSTTEELEAMVSALKDEFERFKEHGFDDYYAKQVEEWVNSNLEYIFGQVVKQVYFGLTEDGYFVAYIPDGWDDIVFDTGADYSLDTYGRLMLRWETDGKSVNQTPETVRG